ncbi:MAG: Hpt domain-containing protein, partial [Bdellovibrionota bacterium]
ETGAPIEHNRQDGEREVRDRLKRRFLDRLAQRVKKLRRLAVERNWEELRDELHQLGTTSDNYGFTSLTEMALAASEAIPAGRISRAAHFPQARLAVETLITQIDDVLTANAVIRA